MTELNDEQKAVFAEEEKLFEQAADGEHKAVERVIELEGKLAHALEVNVKLNADLVRLAEENEGWGDLCNRCIATERRHNELLKAIKDLGTRAKEGL